MFETEGFDRSKVALESRFLNLDGTELRNPVYVKKLLISISEVILSKEIKLYLRQSEDRLHR